jgi:tetratricopeptide (TPR) repeat protein
MLGLILGLLAAAATPSPAQGRIARAQQAIEKNASYAAAYSQLAMAYAQRARETSDTAYYDEADRALARALELEPESPEALKARAWVLLGRHEFAKALEVAEALNRRVPDDLMVYGLLTDAYVELGRYDAAEKSAQWMLDLRPGNVPASTRAAYLRELFGDLEGAYELMAEAYGALPPDESEERAWTLTQLGLLRLAAGRLEDAEPLLAGALQIFPGYHYALGGLGKLRLAQGRFAEAADLQRQRYEAAPHPENLYPLAEALELAGREAEARQTFATFEAEALAESDGVDNANHELVFYLIDHARRPEQALRVAQAELARRQDLHTRHALGWALHASGRHAEAREELQKALGVGIQDATLLYHAGEIALSLGDRAAAQGYFERSAGLKTLGSERARAALARLGGNDAASHGPSAR